MRFMHILMLFVVGNRPAILLIVITAMNWIAFKSAVLQVLGHNNTASKLL